MHPLLSAGWMRSAETLTLFRDVCWLFLSAFCCFYLIPLFPFPYPPCLSAALDMSPRWTNLKGPMRQIGYALKRTAAAIGQQELSVVKTFCFVFVFGRHRHEGKTITDIWLCAREASHCSDTRSSVKKKLKASFQCINGTASVASL